MSFWNLSNNESAAGSTQSYEVPQNNFDPIPEGSSVLAIAEKCAWAFEDENNHSAGSEYIEVTWSVLDPSEFKNRKIKQKLYVLDGGRNSKNPVEKFAQKKDRALKFLAAIDFHSGKKLSKIGGKPTDAQLASVTGKPIIITLGEYAMAYTNRNTGEEGVSRGNHVIGIHSKAEREVSISEAAPVKPSGGNGGGNSRGRASDDGFGSGGGGGMRPNNGGGGGYYPRDDDFGRNPASRVGNNGSHHNDLDDEIPF